MTHAGAKAASATTEKRVAELVGKLRNQAPIFAHTSEALGEMLCLLVLRNRAKVSGF